MFSLLTSHFSVCLSTVDRLDHSTLSVSTLSHSTLSSAGANYTGGRRRGERRLRSVADSQRRQPNRSAMRHSATPAGRHSPSCLLTPKSHSPSRLPPKLALAKSQSLLFIRHPGLQASGSRGLGVSIYFPGHPTSDILISRQPVFNLKQG